MSRNAIHLTAQMYDARDTIKRHYGPEVFAKILANMKPLLDDLSRDPGGLLSGVIAFAKKLEGMERILLIAAYVEHEEPTTPETTL